MPPDLIFGRKAIPSSKYLFGVNADERSRFFSRGHVATELRIKTPRRVTPTNTTLRWVTFSHQRRSLGTHTYRRLFVARIAWTRSFFFRDASRKLKTGWRRTVSFSWWLDSSLLESRWVFRALLRFFFSLESGSDELSTSNLPRTIKRESWPWRPSYFAAAIACTKRGGTFHGGGDGCGTSVGVAYPWRGGLWCLWHLLGRGYAKVFSLVKPSAPKLLFSKTAKLRKPVKNLSVCEFSSFQIFGFIFAICLCRNVGEED